MFVGALLRQRERQKAREERDGLALPIALLVREKSEAREKDFRVRKREI